MIKTVSDLLQALAADLDGHTEPAWYRGHANSKWKLVPHYQRLRRPPPESVLINRFRQNAKLLLNDSPMCAFDWLFVMQHYGVPTRLLDWTESPLVALYFAVIEHPKSDGTLWLLKPLDLNRQTTSKPEEVNFIPSFEDELIQNYATLSVEKNPQKGMLPIAVIAARNTPRIQAQLGVFTISHHTVSPIEELGDKSHVIAYKIPAKSKPDIRHELKLLAVTKFQVFPELSSIGDNIREDL